MLSWPCGARTQKPGYFGEVWLQRFIKKNRRVPFFTFCVCRNCTIYIIEDKQQKIFAPNCDRSAVAITHEPIGADFLSSLSLHSWEQDFCLHMFLMPNGKIKSTRGLPRLSKQVTQKKSRANVKRWKVAHCISKQSITKSFWLYRSQMSSTLSCPSMSTTNCLVFIVDFFKNWNSPKLLAAHEALYCHTS